jgi:hypothetical protein
LDNIIKNIAFNREAYMQYINNAHIQYTSNAHTQLLPTIMRKTLLLTLIFGIIACSSGKKEKERNSFYVINALGADLYERPSLDSKVIKKIKVGKKIIANEILKTIQSKKIENNFYLSGSFIKTQTESINGFIFTSDLTKIKPSLKDIYK